MLFEKDSEEAIRILRWNVDFQLHLSGLETLSYTIQEGNKEEVEEHLINMQSMLPNFSTNLVMLAESIISLGKFTLQKVDDHETRICILEDRVPYPVEFSDLKKACSLLNLGSPMDAELMRCICEGLTLAAQFHGTNEALIALAFAAIGHLNSAFSTTDMGDFPFKVVTHWYESTVNRDVDRFALVLGLLCFDKSGDSVTRFLQNSNQEMIESVIKNNGMSYFSGLRHDARRLVKQFGMLDPSDKTSNILASLISSSPLAFIPALKDDLTSLFRVLESSLSAPRLAILTCKACIDCPDVVCTIGLNIDRAIPLISGLEDLDESIQIILIELLRNVLQQSKQSIGKTFVTSICGNIGKICGTSNQIDGAIVALCGALMSSTKTPAESQLVMAIADAVDPDHGLAPPADVLKQCSEVKTRALHVDSPVMNPCVAVPELQNHEAFGAPKVLPVELQQNTAATPDPAQLPIERMAGPFFDIDDGADYEDERSKEKPVPKDPWAIDDEPTLDDYIQDEMKSAKANLITFISRLDPEHLPPHQSIKRMSSKEFKAFGKRILRIVHQKYGNEEQTLYTDLWKSICVAVDSEKKNNLMNSLL